MLDIQIKLKVPDETPKYSFPIKNDKYRLYFEGWVYYNQM